MKFVFDYFPIILLFLAYPFYSDLFPEFIQSINHLPLLSLAPSENKDGIYFATAIAIVSAFLQVVIYYLIQAIYLARYAEEQTPAESFKIFPNK